MSYMTAKTAKRLAARLKNIVWDEIDPDFRLNHAQKALAEGLGFQHVHAMNSALPCEISWDGVACATYLSTNGFIQDPEDAVQAIQWLEEGLGHLISVQTERMEKVELQLA